MSEIEPYAPPSTSQKLRVLPLIYLIAGVLLGVGATFALTFRPAEVSRSPKLAVATPLYLEQPPSLYHAENSDGPPGTGSPPESKGAAPVTAEQKAEPNPAGEQKAPANPPAPAISGTLPQGPIGGGLQGGSVAPVNPIVIEKDDPPVPQGEYVEYAAIVSEADHSSQVAKVRTLAKSAGGSVVFEFVRNPDRPEGGTELILTVPHSNGAKFRAALQKEAQEIDQWSGPVSERRHRAQRFLRDAEDKLTERLRALQAKYYDDAPAIVQTKELLEHCRRAKSGMGSFPANVDLVKVFVGKSLVAWP